VRESDANPLPAAPRPRGRYTPVVVYGGIAYCAGMTPRVDGVLTARGHVGAEISADEAKQLAAQAAVNALAAVASAVGGVGNLVRCLRLTVYVATNAGFTALSSVADGASEALSNHLGERGSVARSAIGVAELPDGSPIEVELTVAIRTTP
jgi:enamine deaminase RidA (YjgF/YER057c/UK114 family)